MTTVFSNILTFYISLHILQSQPNQSSQHLSRKETTHSSYQLVLPHTKRQLVLSLSRKIIKQILFSFFLLYTITLISSWNDISYPFLCYDKLFNTYCFQLFSKSCYIDSQCIIINKFFIFPQTHHNFFS